MDEIATSSTAIPSPRPYRGFCWECRGLTTSRFFEPIASNLALDYNEIPGYSDWDNMRKECALCDGLMAHFGIPSGPEDNDGDSIQLVRKTISLYSCLTAIISRGTKLPFFSIKIGSKLTIFGPSSILRSVSADFCDIILAKTWIFECLQSHEEHCGQDSSSGFALKVVDCASRKLCEIAPGTPYVCLSYVWGNTSTAHETSSDLSGCLPRTIEDSIWVTLQLGYSYLWIDRYCIDQQNDAEKHRLITNMGTIYRGATVTIIAAAGDGPYSGLPGINGSPRRQQYSHVAGTSGQKIVNFTFPYYDIYDSVGHNRGWAYQELVLSTRRLVFTESQMYFQCNNMHRLEDLLSPYQASPSSDTSLNLGIDQYHFMAFENLGRTSGLKTLYSQLSEYSKRRLSFPEDIIKAVTGIINAFELREITDRVRTIHVFGLPIFYSQTSPTFRLPSERKLSSGVFTPTSTFAYSLSWLFSSGSTKRINTAMDTLFPSWSWASAKIHDDPLSPNIVYWLESPENFFCEESLQIWVHGESDWSAELDHYTNAWSREDDRTLEPMISIRSWVVSGNGKLVKEHDRYTISGFEEKGRLYADYRGIELSDDLAMIYLGNCLWAGTRDEKEGYAILLMVEKVNDSTWRRYGLFQCYEKKVSQSEDTLTWLNRITPEGGWEMRTLRLV